MTTVDLVAWVVVALLYTVGLVAGLIQKRRQDRAVWSQALEHYTSQSPCDSADTVPPHHNSRHQRATRAVVMFA